MAKIHYKRTREACMYVYMLNERGIREQEGDHNLLSWVSRQ